LILPIAIIGATPLIKNGFERLSKNCAAVRILNIAEPIALLSILLVMTAYLVDGSFNPFLYFRF